MERFCGIGMALARGGARDASGENVSGNTNVTRVRWSAVAGMSVVESRDCHFQSVSFPTQRWRLPSNSDDHSALRIVWPASKRLSCKSPMYVVLARSATMTMV
jgi:hypothetical protein